MGGNRVLSKSILLVDDEQIVRETIKMILEMDRHSVTEATNGQEALALFTEASFDLVVTDFAMPRMAGNELAIRIRQLVPTQPIIMITAYGARLGDTENPVNAVLNKPFSLQDLRQTIARVIGPENTNFPAAA